MFLQKPLNFLHKIHVDYHFLLGQHVEYYLFIKRTLQGTCTLIVQHTISVKKAGHPGVLYFLRGFVMFVFNVCVCVCLSQYTIFYNFRLLGYIWAAGLPFYTFR